MTRDDEESDETIEGMMQHLDGAKELKKRKDRVKNQTSRSMSQLQKKMATNPNTAVLSSNFPDRLEELVTYDAVTHRSSKRWVSAQIAVDYHGQLPIYYRQDGMITHTGVITEMVTEPAKNRKKAEKLLENSTDADTYSEHHEEIPGTIYVVTDGVKLDTPFPQTELVKVANDEPIDENYSRQPSFVYQRKGDFSD